MKNETCMVELLFPDAIVYIDSWSNITMQDYPFTWWKYESHDAVHAIYIKQVELWYPHEGIFGVNITVWQPKLGIYGYNKFYFPDLVQIKSYSYVEEKRRALFMEAINEEILGLTWIAIAPIFMNITDFIKKMIDEMEIRSDEK